MKNLRITVNGVAYDVQVEELSGNEAPVSAPVAAAPVKAAVPKKAAAAASLAGAHDKAPAEQGMIKAKCLPCNWKRMPLL